MEETFRHQPATRRVCVVGSTNHGSKPPLARAQDEQSFGGPGFSYGALDEDYTKRQEFTHYSTAAQLRRRSVCNASGDPVYNLSLYSINCQPSGSMRVLLILELSK